MKAHPIETVEQLVTYLQLPVTTDTLIDDVVHYSSFENMKSQVEQKGGDDLGHLR
jgi:predicted RNA-binding protein with PIN domain